MSKHQISGNLSGLSKNILRELHGISGNFIQKNNIIDRETAERLIALTAATGRETALFYDRHGAVRYLSVGDSNYAPLMIKGSGRSRLRCIHTHPGSDPSLSRADISAARNMELDLICALAQGEDGIVAEVCFLGGEICRFTLEELVQTDFLKIVAGVKKESPLKSVSPAETGAVLAGLTGFRTEEEMRKSLDELARLADTAGVSVLEVVTQKGSPSSSSYFGKGKVRELALAIQNSGAAMVIFDDELSPAQQSGLEDMLGCSVIDRTTLILDIFAARAKSAEGKLQVELAQLRYMLPRLTGSRTELSRLGGGIGTRGPGETKLETDRRAVRRRIGELEKQLDAVLKVRARHREGRDGDLPVVALVGYTNAGKSTLAAALSGEAFYAADQLFATLDPVVRRFNLPSGKHALLSDTVGFIRRLPHHLVAAFRATLEEVCGADLLLLVADGADGEAEEQINAVIETLGSLGVLEKPRLTVINKLDAALYPEAVKRLQNRFAPAVAVSASSGDNLSGLLKELDELLAEGDTAVSVWLPHGEGGLMALLYREGEVRAVEYQEGGARVEARISGKLRSFLEKKGYITEEHYPA